LEWSFQHSEHIPFYEKMSLAGRPTPLDDRPELDTESGELWQVYCMTSGEHILSDLDVYARRIGLPDGWEFEECLVLVSNMTKLRYDLEAQKRDRKHTKH
jgi:hypothetical protein